jgi:hypothetical protein
MKIGVALTTVHVPHALKLLRACSPYHSSIPFVKFFVALDQNSPFDDLASFMEPDDRVQWQTPDWQKKWKCSELLGWRTLSRRNSAFLAAVEWGADVIYAWDDDNLALSTNHFIEVARSFQTFNGLCARGKWFDPGTLLTPRARQRGIPHDADTTCVIEPITNAKVGVAAGLVLGDPDIAATTRMENHPEVYDATALGRAGIAVHPDTRTVHNTQATAFLRELAPCMFLMPGLQRFDDIFASLITRRIMRERGLHTHYGPPMVWQSRNKHNLISDLKAEIGGMEHVEHFAHFLDGLRLWGPTVLGDTREIYSQMRDLSYIPDRAIDAARAYLDDCEEILK